MFKLTLVNNFIVTLIWAIHSSSQTDKGFDKSTFNKQMSVLRGQVGLVCFMSLSRILKGGMISGK